MFSYSTKKNTQPAAANHSSIFFQPKLSINQPNDVYEQEADSMADKVMRMSDNVHHSNFFPSSPTPQIQRKCKECEEEEKQHVHRKEINNNEPTLDESTANYVGSLNSNGRRLAQSERNFFEPRFNYDFSNVQLHTNAEANQSAKNINALAYTHGNHIVFGSNQYQSNTDEGKKLMAHELTHVIQQAENPSIQRCPDDATNKAYDAKATDVKQTEAYKKLKNKTVANQIVVDAKKKDNCIFFIDKLQLLFDTAEATEQETTQEFQAETGAAVVEEQQRLSVPEQKANEGVEETAAASVETTGKPIKGKFGGGTYYVDNRDPNNIIVKARVMLLKKGTGTDNDVSAIISMEDAIEKAASTQGYTVDIEFVKTDAKKDAFTAFVDPSQWETATNWSGGAPLGFAHELHHMMALPLDRYNYTSHATNKRMKIPDRLHWFAQELKKPAGYNNPDSIMASGEHPIDDDVCAVAGLPAAKCVTTRQHTRLTASVRAKAFSLCFRARNILTGILPGSPFDKPNEPSQNDINKTRAQSIATSLFGNVSMSQVAELVTQMQYRLTPGLAISLSETTDPECSNKESYLAANGTPPLSMCPQFFTLPETEQVNLMLMEAARMVKLSDRSSEKPCTSANCNTTCGGFNNAADWAKFINCVSNI